MNAKYPRLALLLLAVTTLAIRQWTLVKHEHSRSISFPTEIERVVKASGAEIVTMPEKSKGLFRELIFFKSPSCEDISMVIPMDSRMDMAAVFDKMLGDARANYIRKIIYYGEFFEDGERLKLIPLRVQVYFNWLLGWSDFIPTVEVLYVLEPPQCDASSHIDWRQVWMQPK